MPRRLLRGRHPLVDPRERLAQTQRPVSEGRYLRVSEKL